MGNDIALVAIPSPWVQAKRFDELASSYLMAARALSELEALVEYLLGKMSFEALSNQLKRLFQEDTL